MRLLASIVFYLCITCVEATSQTSSLHFKHITHDQGLISNRILSITQDKCGFMWFGTDNGLCRYDGISFETLNDLNNQFDKSAKILCITEDTLTGNLWIGTNDGIVYYNRSEHKFYRNTLKGTRTLPLKGNIKSLLIDHNRYLWLCVGDVIYCYKNANDYPLVYSFNSRKDFNNSTVFVFEDSEHLMWAGTRSGLYLLDTLSCSVKQIKLPVDRAEVVGVYEDSRTNKWICTMNKGAFLLRKNGEVVHYSMENKRIGSNRVSGVVEDEKGNILMAVRDGGGLHYLDYKTDKISIFSPDVYDPVSISSSAPTCIYKDKFGNIWIGTYSNGLNLIDRYRKPFAYYKVNFKSNGLFNNNIRHIFQDSDGDIWIGTREGGGLSKFDPKRGTFINYISNPNDPYSLNDGYVFSIAEPEKGTLLIGTFKKGLSIFNKRSGRFFHVENNPPDDPNLSNGYIFHLSTDRYDSVWLSNRSTVYTFDHRTRVFKIRLKLPDIKSMLDYDRDNIYFISDGYGLFHYNRKTGKVINYVHNPSDSTSLRNNNLFSIAADKQGMIWLATAGGGVNMFNPGTGKCKAFTVSNGLPSNIICGILIDNHDNIWISTLNGLAKYNRKTQTFKVFDIFDGLQGNEFQKQVCCKTTSGHMLFGGSNGFNYFHPDSIKDNPIVPRVIITDFRIFNKPVGIHDKGSPLMQAVSLTQKLTLTHKQSFITFQFIAINFTSSENNQYAYKLEGFDDDWNYVGGQRSATYTNLPAGKYTFRVKASNNDDVWNAEGTSIEITVLPPWWNSWWFRGLILVTVIGIFYYRILTLRRQKQKLEVLVKERTSQIEIQNKLLKEQNLEIASQIDNVIKLNSKIKKINELRLQFFTNVSHEFRTPLSLILGPTENLLSSEGIADDSKRQLHLIRRNSLRLLNLVNELMDFRSIETQNMPLRLSKIDILRFTEDIAKCFNELAIQRNIKFSVVSRLKAVQAFVDQVKFEKVIFNLISNAFKYTENNGEISVYVNKWKSSEKFRAENNVVYIGKPSPNRYFVEVSVKDTGIGIEQEHLQNIFHEFYRVDQSSQGQTTGNGIGLAMTKELVKLHKGFISVQSEKGAGSIFSVSIPIEMDDSEKIIPRSDNGYDFEYSKSQITALLDKVSEVSETSLSIPKQLQKKEHILVVEDSKDLRSFIIQQLTVEYRVTEAKNGSEALKIALKYTPDLIISDVMMPEMDGFELCKKLKTDLCTSHIPVILLTARTSSESQVQGFETGADDYIQKPFDIHVLKVRIRNLIGSRNKLRQLFGASVEINAEGLTSSPADEKFLTKAISVVNENISNPDFGVNEFVEKMAMSHSFLHKKLASLTQQSAVEFITVIRLKKAIQLMTDRTLNISDVAVMVGFNDPYYFSRCFKKHFGKSPKNYLAEMKRSDIE